MRRNSKPPEFHAFSPRGMRGSTSAGLPPAKGPRGMYFDDRLNGRNERRLPTLVVVNLVSLEAVNNERHERTYTDNISAHGARVRSTYAWRLGEVAEITPANGETPVRGEVVYCQRLDNDGFFVGLKVPESRIPWSILQRFNGADLA